MNKLNPLYILLLVITIWIVSYVKSNDLKNDYELNSSNYENFNKKAKDYKEYKETWFDKTRVTKKLDSIIKSSTFRKEKILKTQNSNRIKVKIESSNPRVLSRFLNRVLNEKFIIRKLNIEKRNILVEIGFK